METITTRGRSVDIPTNIAELNPEQYKYYCFLAFALGSRTIDLDYFRVRWFSFLVGLGKADYTVLMPDYIEELERQAGAIDGFFVSSTVEGVERIHLDFSTTANLLPEFGGYKGPGDWLDGITYGDFVQCLTIFDSIADATPEEVADGYAEIARVLYHVPEAAPVPDLLAFHAPTLFGAVWRAIQAGPIEINGKKIDLRIIFKSAGVSKPDDLTGWTGITFEVASAGLFGSVKEVEATDFWTVLLYLYKCKFEYIHDTTNKK